MKRLFYLLLFVTVCSCSERDIDIPSDGLCAKGIETKANESYSEFYTEKEISEKVSKLFESEFQVSDITLVQGNSQKSSYYLVEFSFSDGNSGYSAYPAFKKIDEPLCFVENGSVQDTVFIEPLKMFFQGIEDYLSLKVKQTEEGTLPVTKSLPDLPSDGTIIDSYTIITQDTLLKTCPVNWGQCAPLGANISDDRGYCSVVAVAQTMAFHQRAFKQIVSQTDWPSMINGQRNDIVACLGYELHQDLYYLGTLIPPLPARVVEVFNNNNYDADSHSGFNASSVVEYMEDGPVILLGFYQNAVTNPGTGHYWIADGCRTTTVTIINVYERDWNGETIQYEGVGNEYVSRVFHYNWGWSGSSNGWFNSGVFQPEENNYNNNMNMIHVQ